MFIRNFLRRSRLVISEFHDKHHFLANILSSGCLMSCGDLLEQELEIHRGLLTNRYDWTRNSRMGITAVLGTPIRHYFYSWIQTAYPKRNLKTVCKKILLDEICLSPWCILSFFVISGMIDGKSYQEINDELVDKYIYVYKGDLLMWPPLQAVNFMYVPVKYQVLVVNFIAMLYNVFLSFAKHSLHTTVEEK